MKKFLPLLFLFIFGFFGILQIGAQTISLEDMSANPGDDILMPINFLDMTDIGTMTLFILFDDNVLTFNGITNVVSQGAGTLAYYTPSPPQVGLSWLAPGSSGVNFPDGKYLDLQFTYHGGYSDLTFAPYSEVTDFDVIPINVTYIDGSVSGGSPLTFDLNVFLEGAYEQGTEGSMRTDLFDSGNIPISQPFGPGLPYFNNNNPAWYYLGTESVSSVPTGTVDWILVELRDAATASAATEATIVAQKPCFILSDGSIVDLDGISNPTFYTSFSQGCFVVIWHRNHLGIMSSVPVPGFGGSYVYDFTTDAIQVAGGSTGYVELESGIWGMAAGDLNADKFIDLQDKTVAWMIDAASQEYSGSDANLDIQINNPDKNEFILKNNNLVSGVPD